MERAKPGEKPVVAAADVTIVGTVTEIAPDKTSVTLKSRDGGLEKLPVKNPENLTGVMVGDEVTINATRAVAVSVAPPRKPLRRRSRTARLAPPRERDLGASRGGVDQG